jgi:hypothetical protein
LDALTLFVNEKRGATDLGRLSDLVAIWASCQLWLM